jgi:hypothetical protein
MHQYVIMHVCHRRFYKRNYVQLMITNFYMQYLRQTAKQG